jgi:hypothetical protein
MSLDISRETETRLILEAQKQGISVEALLGRLMNDRSAATISSTGATQELPLWHLGEVGALHRREIYDDAN